MDWPPSAVAGPPRGTQHALLAARQAIVSFSDSYTPTFHHRTCSNKQTRTQVGMPAAILRSGFCVSFSYPTMIVGNRRWAWRWGRATGTASC